MWEEEDQQDQFRSGQVNGPGFKDGTAMAVKVTIAQWAIAVLADLGRALGNTVFIGLYRGHRANS
jgi:hypothetical protein